MVMQFLIQDYPSSKGIKIPGFILFSILCFPTKLVFQKAEHALNITKENSVLQYLNL